jgi:hypothetical protein
VGWYSKHDMVTVLKWNTILIWTDLGIYL